MTRQKNFFNLTPVLVVFPVLIAALLTTAEAGAAQNNSAAVSSQKTTAASGKSARKTAGKETEKKAGTRLTVYYFHGYARCASCRKIEQYTKEAAESLGSSFAGKVDFVPVNVEEKANEHFIRDYQLVSKSVILQSEIAGKPGAWKNLDRIWLELGDRAKFIAYVKENIITQLESR